MKANVQLLIVWSLMSAVDAMPWYGANEVASTHDPECTGTPEAFTASTQTDSTTYNIPVSLAGYNTDGVLGYSAQISDFTKHDSCTKVYAEVEGTTHEIYDKSAKKKRHWWGQSDYDPTWSCQPLTPTPSSSSVALSFCGQTVITFHGCYGDGYTHVVTAYDYNTQCWNKRCTCSDSSSTFPSSSAVVTTTSVPITSSSAIASTSNSNSVPSETSTVPYETSSVPTTIKSSSSSEITTVPTSNTVYTTCYTSTISVPNSGSGSITSKCSGDFSSKAKYGNYPAASIEFSKFTYKSSGVYEVTLDFSAETSLSISDLNELKIIGLNSPNGGTIVLYSLNSKVYSINNPNSWSWTFDVNVDSSNCISQFQIQYDWKDSTNWSYNKSYDYFINCGGDGQSDAPIVCAGNGGNGGSGSVSVVTSCETIPFSSFIASSSEFSSASSSSEFSSASSSSSEFSSASSSSSEFSSASSSSSEFSSASSSSSVFSSASSSSYESSSSSESSFASSSVVKSSSSSLDSTSVLKSSSSFVTSPVPSSSVVSTVPSSSVVSTVPSSSVVSTVPSSSVVSTVPSSSEVSSVPSSSEVSSVPSSVIKSSESSSIAKSSSSPVTSSVPSSTVPSSTVPSSSEVSTVPSSSVPAVTPSACDFKNIQLSSGFRATFYDYELNSKDATTKEEFYESGYQSYSVISTASGITDVTINDISKSKNSFSGTVYGQTISISNFVVELTGYFKATESGSYTFSLSGVDDGASLFIGSSAFDCCSEATSSTANGSPLLFTYKPSTSAATTVSGSTSLEAGALYPIKIVYVNVHQSATLKVTVTDTTGAEFTIGDDVYQIENFSGVCSGSSSSSIAHSSTIPSSVPSGSSTGPSSSPVSPTGPSGSTTVPSSESFPNWSIRFFHWSILISSLPNRPIRFFHWSIIISSLPNWSIRFFHWSIVISSFSNWSIWLYHCSIF
ncbi:unnamed protein product [Ambrosiozyma monospora]|uniref:Unnamed protein product n=1 Tax=Ambrosiozyma monospora TaxID=43982 RepID=A0A9W6YUC8_AMBMO|nr:unnamed protein product [Ambrosiozyma monospora]